MKAGVMQFGGQAYNLNPAPVTVNGVTYQPANGGTVATPAACDPRGLGLNPAIGAVWALEPTGNQPSCGTAVPSDGVNTLCFDAPVGTPLSENFGVIRLDHQISSKWQFSASYRYDKTTFAAPVQADIGGLLKGDTKGQPATPPPRPVAPPPLVANPTAPINPHLPRQTTI